MTSELLVFAAASTADVLQEIGRDFQSQTGVTPRFSFGASRDLGRQIRAGAPADLLVSADTETIDSLLAEHLVHPDDRRRLMSNQLVVIVAAERARSLPECRTPDDLANFSRIALGDPATVPAGAYGKAWLQRVGLWSVVEERVIPVLDVRAALAAVESGHAEAGIVYRTDALSSKRVRIAYEVPVGSAPPIAYAAAILSRSRNPAARAFLEFLGGPQAHATLARHGFIL